MFKKTVVLSVAVALIMLGLFVDPSAAQVTSVSKRGSLLVWPKIVTFTSPVKEIDTVVTIGNDSASPTWVKCYWMDSAQNAWDFEFPLTANQPAFFSAKNGFGSKEVSEFGDNKTGELKCWAIDINPPLPETTEVLRQFNYLYGSAVYVESLPRQASFEYEAWAFALNTVPADKNGPLNLNGTEYDYCPSYLTYNFFGFDTSTVGLTEYTTFYDSVLSLSPCQQDLRQDRLPVCTKAKFDIWNENENKLTGAYQCVKCYFEGVLRDIGSKTWGSCNLAALGGTCKKTGVGGAKFTGATLHTDLGRFRVSPELSTACNNVFAKVGGTDLKTVVDVCSGNQYKSPFIGVLMTELLPYAALQLDYAATTGTQAGQFTGITRTGGTQPQILWDAADVSAAVQR